MSAGVHPQWDLEEIDDLQQGPALGFLLADPLHRRSITVPRVFAEPANVGPARIGWDATETHTITKGLRGPECLLSFIQLHDKADQVIVRLAKRWGPLGICQHGKPATHHPECMPLAAPD